ncbi:Ig-like domain-containing protein [Gloeobacter violaceus]|uniref:Gll3705 protein n=1 Tax=Gloeobacter violaceus (strain ATCC 29082 / PCC 7421) TaxID=251221 RepID=Q7NF22_GLOVI|nr:Ig-like domain-containing protein [Gloeobacter violaceus]BAC91646.1 gll3705 [Gloeobacter violaceus PCC 7421]
MPTFQPRAGRLAAGGFIVLVLSFFLVSPAAAARNWWVFLSPTEAELLYKAASFSAIKSEVDNDYLNGLSEPKTCLDTRSPWVQQMAAAQEMLSATYLALKWGKYGGADNSELDAYRERIADNWKAILEAGPIDLWQDNFDGVTRQFVAGGCDYTQSYQPGWYEGDIALRFWIFGALPSYDAVRDELSTSEREAIDTWLRGLADQLWSGRDFGREHNRGASAVAQAHVIALVLQDRSRFESYYSHASGGLKDYYRQMNYAPLAGCDFPERPGLTSELASRDGIHGVQTVMHSFGALAVIAHAGHMGGNVDWNIYNTTRDPNLLAGVLGTWYDIEEALRDEFNSYIVCLENETDASESFEDTSLDERVWAPLAFFQTRFQNVDSWGLGNLRALRKERASLHAQNRLANQKPTVELTAPASGAKLTAPATVTLNAEARDNNGTVSKVEFFRDSTKIGEDLASPYSATWKLAEAGTYALKAKVTDSQGVTADSTSRTITVSQPSGLSVYLVQPLDGAFVAGGSDAKLQAVAAHSSDSISKVEFYQGSTKLGSDSASPYFYTWVKPPSGSYSLTAKAISSTGATITSSAIDLSVGSPNTAPTANMVDPEDGAQLTAPATVSLHAEADDSDGTISQVEFFSGGVKLGQDTTSPYYFSWKGMAAGKYSIAAVATDNRGAVFTSAAVGVTVSLPTPWQLKDIGNVGLTGNAAFNPDSDTFTIKAAGADIWGDADGFMYVYQPISGDGQLVARVSSLGNTDSWAKAGIMIRDGFTSSARNVFVGLTPSKGITFQYRTKTGGDSGSKTVAGYKAPYWLKLVRTGDTIKGYYSSNGGSWVWIGTQSIPMATDLFMGLAVTSHDSAELTTAAFTDVSASK